MGETSGGVGVLLDRDDEIVSVLADPGDRRQLVTRPEHEVGDHAGGQHDGEHHDGSLESLSAVATGVRCTWPRPLRE